MTDPGAPCGAGACLSVAADGWTVCRRHGLEAGEMLAALGSEYELLSAAPAGTQRREGEAVSGGTPKHLRSPANLDVLVVTDSRSKLPVDGDLDGNAAPAVLTWVLNVGELIRAERVPGDPFTLVFAVARTRIAQHLGWVLSEDWAGGFVWDLRGHLRALRRLNSAPIPRPRRGRCRACGQAALGWDGATAACTSCGGSWSGLAVLRPTS